MKKTLLLISISLTTALSAFAYSTTPTAPVTIYTTDTIALHSSAGIENFNEYACVYTTGNTFVSQTLFHFSGNTPAIGTTGTYKVYMAGSDCSFGVPLFPDYTSGIYTVTLPPPPPDPPVEHMINNASSSFNSTIGFNPSQTVSWVGNNMIKPFIGGGVMLLMALKLWIIALVVLSAIIYFAYRAFRFYKH